MAVFSVQKGEFGFVDSNDVRYAGHQKIVCQLTVRDGKLVYDLNGFHATAYAAPRFPLPTAAAAH